MQFGFRFQILLFTTSERFSTKTLAYLAYKAFMAFKRSRLNPFQNYRSITSFSVDWPRTIRLVYASVSISSVCAIMLQVIVIRTRWNTKRPTKEFSKQKSRVRHVTRTCPCMTTSIIIKITRDQHVNIFTLIGSQLVVMVLRAQWPLGTIARSVNHAMSWSKNNYSWLDLSRWTERLSRGLLSSNMGSSLCLAKLPELQSFRKQLFTGTFFILNFCLYHMLGKKIT